MRGVEIYIESNEQQVKEVETLVMDNDRLINELTQYKQALTEITNTLLSRIPCYLNISQAKSLIEVEYDYAGRIYYIEQRMHKILQIISECEGNDD